MYPSGYTQDTSRYIRIRILITTRPKLDNNPPLTPARSEGAAFSRAPLPFIAGATSRCETETQQTTGTPRRARARAWRRRRRRGGRLKREMFVARISRCNFSQPRRLNPASNSVSFRPPPEAHSGARCASRRPVSCASFRPGLGEVYTLCRHSKAFPRRIGAPCGRLARARTS
jgi:hypothetical protein